MSWIKIDSAMLSEYVNDNGVTNYYGTILISNNANVDIELRCSGTDCGEDTILPVVLEAIEDVFRIRFNPVNPEQVTVVIDDQLREAIGILVYSQEEFFIDYRGGRFFLKDKEGVRAFRSQSFVRN